MNKKPAPGRLSNKTLQDWSNLKLMLLEDALSKESHKEILFITSYQDASQHLISGLRERFSRSFATIVCNIAQNKKTKQGEEIRYTLDSLQHKDYSDLAEAINENYKIKLVVLQYETSLFPSLHLLTQFLSFVKKPVAIAFDSKSSLIEYPSTDVFIIDLINACDRVVVHTEQEQNFLIKQFGIEAANISIFPSTPSAFAHFFKRLLGDEITIRYNLPDIESHAIVREYRQRTELKQQPELQSLNVTNDDLQALTPMCMRYELTGNANDLNTLTTQLNFIYSSFSPIDLYITSSPKDEVTIGHAICNLGFVYSRKNILPSDVSEQVDTLLLKALKQVDQLQSPCAIAYSIKGLYYYFSENHSFEISKTIERLGDKLANLYIRHASISWSWFEQYITYANCILAEALLFAYLSSHKAVYKKIAINAFDFLLIKAFSDNSINSISSKSRFTKEDILEQEDIKPGDVACLIQSLSTFYDVFKDETYVNQMEVAFSWFLGNNHLYHSVYDSTTGASHSAVENSSSHTFQNLSSASSYLTARITMENILNPWLIEKLSSTKRHRKKFLANKTRV
jgi:hypothetical protein